MILEARTHCVISGCKGSEKDALHHGLKTCRAGYTRIYCSIRYYIIGSQLRHLFLLCTSAVSLLDPARRPCQRNSKTEVKRISGGACCRSCAVQHASCVPCKMRQSSTRLGPFTQATEAPTLPLSVRTPVLVLGLPLAFAKS